MRTEHRSDAEKEAGAGLLKDYGELFKRQHQDFEGLCGGGGGDSPWADNNTYAPILVAVGQDELLPITQLVSSDNTVITKVLSVLSSLCVEVMALKREAFERHLEWLSVYEEYSSVEAGPLLAAMCELSAFTVRCDDVLRNLCAQLLALYTEDVLHLNGMEVHYVINHIGELLVVIALVELAVARSGAAAAAGVALARRVAAASGDPAVGAALQQLTDRILTDSIVHNTLHNLASLRTTLVNNKCAAASTEFTNYLKRAIPSLDALVQEEPTTSTMYKCIKINVLFVLSSHLFGNTDKKMFKSLMELNTKAHSVHVMGTVVWFPEEFLQRHCAAAVGVGAAAGTLGRARRAALALAGGELGRRAHVALGDVAAWSARADTVFGGGEATRWDARDMGEAARLAMDARRAAGALRRPALYALALHGALGAPLPHASLAALFAAVHALQALRDAVHRHRPQLLHSIDMSVNHHLFQASRLIGEARRALAGEGGGDADALTCLLVAERCVLGAPTARRLTAAQLALGLLPPAALEPAAYAKLAALLDDVHALLTFLESLDRLCDCSWLLWHRYLLPVYFDQNFATQINITKVKYFLMALEDCAALLRRTDERYRKEKCKEFMDEIRSTLDERLVRAVAQSVETNLRLHIHSHLQPAADYSPFAADTLKRAPLVVDRLRVGGEVVSVVGGVEHYLSAVYYNLTTLALGDWRAYGEMRAAARLKLRLAPVPDGLPPHAAGPALDVVAAARRVDRFVARHRYQLHNQLFVERAGAGGGRTLAVLGARHAADSLRAHGPGVLSTAVNLVYQFLRRQFHTFSQFLFDEQIKSRLAAETRRLRAAAVEGGTGGGGGGGYPFSSAVRLRASIEALGGDGAGRSYLEQFRELVGGVGNALGVVRLLRAGAAQCAAAAAAHLPPPAGSFVELSAGAGADAARAAAALDEAVAQLAAAAPGAEYLSLLVAALAPALRSARNAHLRGFAALVPALSLSHVHHMIACKDRLSKGDELDAAFADDGFAMGLAYILKVLDQERSFASLQWWEGVWAHCACERARLVTSPRSARDDVTTAALSRRRIDTLEREFRLLYYTLSSAAIFFR